MSAPLTEFRRIKITHTSSYVYDSAVVDKAWFEGPKIPSVLCRGDEDTNPDSRAATVYEAYGDALVDLFHPLQDDDSGYEVEDYDPEA